MITMSKESAFEWLWGTTLINLGFGALLWAWNTVALSIDEFDWSSDKANAMVWQEIGSGLWGFGVLAFVITLATSAVVGAIDGKSAKSVKDSAPRTSLDEKFNTSSERKTNSIQQIETEESRNQKTPYLVIVIMGMIILGVVMAILNFFSIARYF
jgi:hypothetical protein